MDDTGNPNSKKTFSKKWKRFWGGVHNGEDVTEEEIISMVNEGHEQGVLQAQEAEMIHNIFEFGDKEAKDIMTHRKNMIAIDGDLSYTDAVEFIVENGKSRYPVFDGDIDTIIGVIHIKDAFAFSKRNEVFRTAIKDIPKLIREVEFIPETMKINALFTKMQMEKNHMVIVVDEYGQTAGIVAMEDILEEIVGNIEDEHDEEEQTISVGADGTIHMDGMTNFEDVVKELQLPLEPDAFETLNGFLISLLGKVLHDDETAKVNAYGYCFAVQSVEDNRIADVWITKSEENTESLAQEDKE